jgi:hypothetical protein
MKNAKKISPIIRIGVCMNPGIQGKPQGNPHGNPIILEKPEKTIAQTNMAKMLPNAGDRSSKGP